MGEKSVAPASFQQIDLLRQISELPISAEHYDGILMLQLDGPLNVSALIGAIEDLVERHPTLRTTLNAEAAAPVQEIHAGLVLPVLVAQPGATSITEAAYEARTTRLCGAEAASGAPLFRAEIAVLDGTHLLTLRAYHLITDAWSDAIMLRDLAEFYRARVEQRSPNLPKLALTYDDFARRQHADWPALRSRVVEHWAPLLDGYPGSVVWPGPAETPDDPYACRTIACALDAQATLGVRMAARDWRVLPFLVLVAATTLAIGDMTGQYDLIIGSNVANREAMEKRQLIGYFTNTRLMRIRLTSDMNLEAATAIVREQWLAGDDFRDAYIDQVLTAVGLPRVMKIDALDLPPSLGGAALDLPNVGVRVPPSLDSGRMRHWRDLNVTWIPAQDGFRIEIRHRLAAVDRAMATAVAERASAILTQLTREESPA